MRINQFIVERETNKYEKINGRMKMKKERLFIIVICLLCSSFLMATSAESLDEGRLFGEENPESVQRTEYFVDFEGPGEVKTSYASGDVVLSGKNWNLDNVLIGTADNDMKFGLRSARFRHQDALDATMTMLEDKVNGLGTLSFYYARSNFANDRLPTAPVIVVEYSLDQGAEWLQIGNDIDFDGVDELTLFSQTVNVEGSVRIRFRSISGTDGRRFNVDDILMTDYGDEESVAMPTFSPPAGTYYGSVWVSISTVTPDATIHYTLDGSDPTENSPVYTEPIEVDESMTIKARGYADDLNPSLISTAVYTINYPVQVNDMATLRDSPQDGTVYALSNEVVLTFQQSFRNQKFVQDNTGGILIDDQPGTITTDYQVGDGISNLTGTLSTFGNMLQFSPVQDPGTATSQNNPITVITITLSDFINNLMDYQGRVVKVNNVHFPNADGVMEFANGQVYALSDGTDSISFRTTFYDVDYIGTVIPDEVISLRGIPNSRSEGDFFTARNLNDFLPATGDIDVTIQPESVSFGNLMVDQVSEPVEITITNTGSVTISIIEAYLDGSDTAEFVLEDANVYPAVLAPNEEISFSVSFSPSSTGLKEAYVEFEAADDLTSVFYQINLSGTGVLLNPPLNLEATIINWHDIELNWDAPATGVGSRGRTLLGYYVYRNDVQISPDTPISDSFYMDPSVPAGDYDYYTIAVYSDGYSSPSNIAEISVLGPLPDVEMSPEPGEYQQQVEVTLSLPDTIDGVTVFYTLDGTEPSDDSIVYEQPVVITETTTLKAVAYKQGWETGGVASGEYIIVTSAEDTTLPQFSTTLKQNHPNPFNPDTSIGFYLAETGRVELSVYNVKGERVKTLINDLLPSGEHKVIWSGVDENGRDMPSGVYFYRMRTTKHDQIRKMVMIK